MIVPKIRFYYVLWTLTVTVTKAFVTPRQGPVVAVPTQPCPTLTFARTSTIACRATSTNKQEDPPMVAAAVLSKQQPQRRRGWWWRRFLPSTSSIPKKLFSSARKKAFRFMAALTVAVALLFPTRALASEKFSYQSTVDRTILEPTPTRNMTRPGIPIQSLAIATGTGSVIFHLVKRKKSKDKDIAKSEKLETDQADKLGKTEEFVDKEHIEETKDTLSPPLEQPNDIIIADAAAGGDDDGDGDEYEVIPEFQPMSDFIREKRSVGFSADNQFIGFKNLHNEIVGQNEKTSTKKDETSMGVLEYDDSIQQELGRVTGITKEWMSLKEKAATTEYPLWDAKHIQARMQPKPKEEEDAVAAKYAQISSVSERAFQILLDLGMIEESSPVDMTKFEDIIDMDKE